MKRAALLARFVVATMCGFPVELLCAPMQALRMYLGGSEAGEVPQ